MHVLRRVLCVCTGLCVFVSRAEVQPFISGADCRQGEYSDLALLLFNFTYLLFGLFEDSLDSAVILFLFMHHSHNWK